MKKKPSALTARLTKNVKKNGYGDVMSKSEFAKIDYYVKFSSVLVNLLYSAKWDGGIPSGRISMPAGPKSSGKSQLAYDAMIEFQKGGGTIVLFDSEYASEIDALTNLGLDPENTIYMPVTNMQDEDKAKSITYQFMSIMKEISRTDKVMFVFDSMGAWISKGTIANAEKNNTAMNMKIASEKKQLMALINAEVGAKGVPCVVINHSYTNVGGFGSATEVSGGGALYYPSAVVEVTSKANLKIGDEKVGKIFSCTNYKGRIAREGITGKFAMHPEHGFLKYYGLDLLALEGGYIAPGKKGQSIIYEFDDKEGNKHTCPKKSYFMPENDEFWETLLKDSDFGQFLNDVYAYGSNKNLNCVEIIETDTKNKMKTKKEEEEE